jgi:hypothetical protein
MPASTSRSTITRWKATRRVSSRQIRVVAGIMQTIQLAISDSALQATLREALARSGPWHVEIVETPRLGEKCVLVLDEVCLSHMPLPLPFPERIVLLTRKDPAHLSYAWDAGLVSLVSPDDPPATVLLAIMAAALRVPKMQPAAVSGGNSPSKPVYTASISPEHHVLSSKQHKT